MARVLVLSSTFPASAHDTRPAFVRVLSERLARSHQVHILTQHLPGTAAAELMGPLRVTRYRYLPEAWERLGVDGAILPGLKRHPLRWLALPFFLAAQAWAAKRIIQSQDIDLIHAHWVLPQGLGAVLARYLAGSDIPIVCTSHGSDIFGLRGTLSRSLIRWVLRRIQALTGVSRELVRHTSVLGLDPALTHVMPMGIDSQTLFIPAPTPRPPAAGARLLFVGRLSRVKGADILLHAMPRILTTDPQARLTLVGGGEEADALHELAKTLGVSEAVSFEGPVRNERLPPYYQAADCLVLPSRSEGLGLSMLEAMACGCPVIASDLPAIGDAIRPRESGLLVPPGDSDAIAETVLSLRADPDLARRLADRARKTVTEHFDWAVAAARYAALFSRLLDRQSSPDSGTQDRP